MEKEWNSSRDKKVYSQMKELKGDLVWAEEQLEKLKNKVASINEKSMIGKRFKERTFDNFEGDEFKAKKDLLVRYTNEFNDETKKGFMIIGTVGVGKTHLASAVANGIMDRGHTVRFITSVELLQELRDFDNQRETLDELKRTQLLIVDDLGKEKMTDWVREKLFDIINSRYESYKPIIITSNCDSKTLKDNLGEAIYSRLCEMCYGIKMEGKDYRVK